jgi:hypothetical protein
MDAVYSELVQKQSTAFTQRIIADIYITYTLYTGLHHT